MIINLPAIGYLAVILIYVIRELIQCLKFVLKIKKKLSGPLKERKLCKLSEQYI
jgi:hypothetical protein